MSHPPLSLMNRLSKTESAIFTLRMLYFQRMFFWGTYNLHKSHYEEKKFCNQYSFSTAKVKTKSNQANLGLYIAQMVCMMLLLFCVNDHVFSRKVQ